MDFIIDFTNTCIESYRQSSKYEALAEVVLHLDGGDVKQYLSDSVWCMYRGSGSSAVPYLLQSIHMALEKRLLEFSQIPESDKVEQILYYILKKSTSTSLTAVVCSIILAHPDKFYKVAKVLFRTIEFFQVDSIRCMFDLETKSKYRGIDSVIYVYANERLQMSKDNHRSLTLETLILNYQFLGIKELSEEENTLFIEELYSIIDNHKSTLSSNPNYEKKHWDILLARMDRRNQTPKISKQVEKGTLIEFEVSGLSEERKEQREQAHIEFAETFKYSDLSTWSFFLNDKYNQNSNQKIPRYDENPFLALSDTKQLVQELNSGRSSVMSMAEYSIPAFSCSKLMLEYRDKLSKEDKDFCKEIILSTLADFLSDEYSYKIGDGVEACVGAIPALISEYPDEIEVYLIIMILVLFDGTPIGAYKRICDYALESIHESKLWESNPKHAQSILFGYIKLKPIYRSVVLEIRKDRREWGSIPKILIYEQFEKQCTDFTFDNITLNVEEIDLFNIRDFEIVCQLIPTDTRDTVHLDIYRKYFHLMAPKLLNDRRHNRESDDESDAYLQRLYILRRITYFLLQRETSEIDIFLKPFVDSMSSTEETASFIDELISAENNLGNYEQFWYIWNALYSRMKELCDNPRHYDLKRVITNYLLAGFPWREDIEEWHSLKKDSLSLYVNVSNELGHVPAVLYSVTKILNLIGSKFSDDGINWIYTIVSKQPSLQLGDLETNTLIYLEMFIRKFVYSNKTKIKKEVRLKNKVLLILDFMIERGSIHGYLLRESIL